MKTSPIVTENAGAPWGAMAEVGGNQWVDSLLADPDRAGAVPLDHVPAVLGQIERLKAILWSRLSQADAAARRPASANELRDDGRVLTPAETAQIAGVTVRWLYRHAGQLPFARRLSRKTLRFSEAGLRRWLACRRP